MQNRMTVQELIDFLQKLPKHKKTKQLVYIDLDGWDSVEDIEVKEDDSGEAVTITSF